jgi:XTP/dITP diphosphohydrolase
LGRTRRALRLGLVTMNKHKLEEAAGLAGKYGITIYQIPLEKHEIQFPYLEEIALYAAREAFRLKKLPLIVDDSGLFVEALNGFPGPYSSYVYKTIGYTGLLKLMEGQENRRACFKTVIALILPPVEKLFIGETCGSITEEPRGHQGFGFDPVFLPEGCNRTYAEMSLEEKNSVSHRGKAFKRLAEYLNSLI